MDQLPSEDEVKETLTNSWRVSADAVRPCTKSARLFEVDGLGFARLVFPRGPLSAFESVELLDFLNRSGCAAPGIVPTTDGKLAVELKGVAIAVEQRLPGQECTSKTLHVLPFVGRELARLHSGMFAFPGVPGEDRPLTPWVEERLSRALATAQGHHLSAVRQLHANLPEELTGRTVPWALTHGDVRGPNVLFDGQAAGFTDFNPRYAPQLSDVAMIRNKWLMNGDIPQERPLTTEEIAAFVAGYCQIRPFTDDERAAFPVIWAVYHAERLFQDRRILSEADHTRQSRWPIDEQIAALPRELAGARAILDQAALLAD